MHYVWKNCGRKRGGVSPWSNNSMVFGANQILWCVCSRVVFYGICSRIEVNMNEVFVYGSGSETFRSRGAPFDHKKMMVH